MVQNYEIEFLDKCVSCRLQGDKDWYNIFDERIIDDIRKGYEAGIPTRNDLAAFFNISLSEIFRKPISFSEKHKAVRKMTGTKGGESL